MKVKAYIENPDASGIPDHMAANQAWDAHRKRNNSIIIDLFYVSQQLSLLVYGQVVTDCYMYMFMFHEYMCVLV